MWETLVGAVWMFPTQKLFGQSSFNLRKQFIYKKYMMLIYSNQKLFGGINELMGILDFPARGFVGLNTFQCVQREDLLVLCFS